MYKFHANYYYLKEMDLHTTRLKADWDYTRKNQRNGWQRLAVRSGGLLTPGNVITWLGLALVIFGLRQVSAGRLTQGVIIILCGRLFDILDGLAAHYTKTKSPLGELTDSVADKITIFACALVVIIRQLIPWYIVILLVVIQLFITLLTATARLRQIELHPTRNGKLSFVFTWLGLLVYIFSDNKHLVSHDLLRSGADICIIIGLVLGAQALYSYAKTVAEYYGKRLH